jgi:hypothetical protein
VSGDSFFAEAEARYREAVERRDAIRDAWQASGGELLSRGSTDQLVEHPLVKMLREHDVLVDRLAKAVEKAGGTHRGPMPSAVITPSIGKSPATKLRSVK